MHFRSPNPRGLVLKSLPRAHKRDRKTLQEIQRNDSAAAASVAFSEIADLNSLVLERSLKSSASLVSPFYFSLAFFCGDLES